MKLTAMGIIFILVVLLISLQHGDTIKCNIGYGQRGKLRNAGYEWVCVPHDMIDCITICLTCVIDTRL